MKKIFTLSAILLSTSCLFALPSEDERNQETEIIENYKSLTSNSNNENDEDLLNPALMGGPKKRLEAIGYRLEAEETDEENIADGTTNYESLTDNSNDESTKNFLNPTFMGGPVNLTTAAARWLFKTGSNKIVTRPFVRLGTAIEVPSREYSNIPTNHQTFSNWAYHSRPLLPSPIAVAVSPASFQPAGRIAKRSFSSVPPIKDNELNNIATNELTQNKATTFSKKTIEEFEEDIQKRITNYGIVQGEVSVAQGEEAVKLLEKFQKEEQELSESLDQYIRFLQEVEKNAPTALKEELTQRLEEAQYKKNTILSNILSNKLNKVAAIAASALSKATGAQREEAVNLWEESKNAAQTVIDVLDQYIEALQRASATTFNTSKIDLKQRIEQAQGDRNTRLLEIRYHDINKANAIASLTEEKAFAAQGEEAIKLLDASRKATQDALEIQDQCIVSLQEAEEELSQRMRSISKLASANEVKGVDGAEKQLAAKGELNQRMRLLSKLASADEVRGVDGAEKLSVQELLDASGVDISLPSSRDVVETDVARRTKDFDAGLYASYCPSQNSSSTQHSSSLPQVVVDGNETIRSNTDATKQFAAEVEFRKKSIEEAQYRRSSMANHAITKRTDKIAEITDNAYKKAALLKEEEAVRFWEKSKQLVQSLVEDQDLYIASLQAIQKRASFATQADWNQRIEDAQHKRALMVCNVWAQEANKAAAINNNAKNRVNDAQSEEMIKLWEESKQAALNLVDVQNQYIKAFQDAKVTASLEKKLALNKSIEEAQNNRAVTVCNIFAMVVSKEKILTNMSYHQANTAQGEEAIELWAKAKQAAQAFIETTDQHIKALQEAQIKAPLAAKKSWNQRIENAQGKRSEMLCNILAQDIIGANTIDNMVQAKAAAAQGEEAVKLFEQSKQSSQVLLELRDQYIRILQEISDKAPSEMKLALNLVIEKIKDERAETACNVFAKEVSKLRILSTMSQDKAATAPGEEAVRLWTESKKAAQALLEAQDQYMSVLQDVKANTPLETQKKWEQRVDEAQQNRDTKVCSIYCRELFKLNALDDIATAKASAAQGIEAIKLWEESKQVAEELVTAHDQYIRVLQEARGRATKKTTQTELAQRIEDTKVQKNSIICAICTKEINKARALIFITHDKAICAEGEEAVKLWEESRKACQSLLDAQNHYIEALQLAKKEAPLAMQEELNHYIIKAEFERVMMPCNILGKEINKANIINDMTQKKAVAARGKEAVKLWEESKQAAQKLLELQNQYIKVLREVQAKAPAAAKEEWNQHIEEALRNRAIMISNVLSKKS